ncbi:MAG: hypothetical protein PHR06_11255, partial [Candidatus Cloacimonetes bacterium]|nr:hypothetical protein [Candidatus Cloacimonadota bacterium]
MKRFLTVLAILSFVFNIAFIAIYIHSRIKLRKCFVPEEVQKYRDKDWFKKIGSSRRESRKLSSELDKEKDHFFEELRKESFNESELVDLKKVIVKRQAELEEFLIQQLISIRKEMTAEEARGFFAFRPDRHRYDRRPDTRKPEMNRRNN